jgi:hypothetical protein
MIICLFFLCATHRETDEVGEIIWQRVHSFSVQSIHLGSNQEDHGKIVEEKQEDKDKAYRACITSHKMGHVKWKEEQKDL